MRKEPSIRLTCPIPRTEYETIQMAHGGGGKLTGQLIDRMFMTALGNPILEKAHDGAFLSMNTSELAFTTDSFVVNPLFFPGGSIGDLAVNGTVNDLACCGSVPLFLSLAFILEEGLPIETLWQVVLSIKKASEQVGVKIVTGDTKVVEKGKGDAIFINTSGIGERIKGTMIGPERCRPGDVVIINGPIAEHGIAILSRREGLDFSPSVRSDTAPLSPMITDLLQKVRSVNVLRDPTRGGLASALNEICGSSGTGIELYEENIPVSEAVRGACEILGLDPLYIANEGKVLVILPEKDAEKALEILRSHAEGTRSTVIGKVLEAHPGMVRLKTLVGSTRIVDMISGEQLPRIC
jgi:hydrogenase expression/formation protein HypE